MKKTRLLNNNFQILRDKVLVLRDVLEIKYELIFSLRSEIKELKESIKDLRDLSALKNKDLLEMSNNSILLQGKVNIYKGATYLLSAILVINSIFDLIGSSV